ncbi:MULTISPECIES: diacylglycerol kinase [Flavobacteriaceae]|jgi:diacylglycerol kinase (ATP)|uniref:Diacylglycerol kinase family protein n=2 Tax=Flavobacteriaceae TaxID=49546 RepID=A0ABN1JZP1_9FLAO|nr:MULTISPECIES: diacylglycerol kinase family protein [Flavobacteriaceae]RYH71950.1 diacylglycerol kinase family protein [Flavobacteriaceae bacterium 144Ye]TDY07246.1 diacylglycerol kinase (ATP) [Meridianimaribacter flavus]
MPKKESFLQNRLKSVGFAYKGAAYLIKTEASIKIQIVVAILVTAAGFYFNISTTEWLFQIAFIGLVISIEGVNTAVEYIADFIHPEHHKSIGRIKDIAAGAVFIASVTAIIGALVIYIPKLF